MPSGRKPRQAQHAATSAAATCEDGNAVPHAEPPSSSRWVRAATGTAVAALRAGANR